MTNSDNALRRLCWGHRLSLHAVFFFFSSFFGPLGLAFYLSEMFGRRVGLTLDWSAVYQIFYTTVKCFGIVVQ